MTATTEPAAGRRRPMDAMRTTALVAGLLYLVTFISSIPAALLLESGLQDPSLLISAASDGPIRLAAVLDLVNALACIGTAVALFSVVKRQHEGLALGFVTTRMFEAGVLALGVISVLTVVTVREAAAASGSAAAFLPVSQALIAMRDWTFIVGPSMASLNALMLGTLLYRSRLVPRAIPALGIVGAPLLISFAIGTMLGLTEPGTAWHAIAVMPFFFWELFVGLWLTFKGFNRTASILGGDAAKAAAGAASGDASTGGLGSAAQVATGTVAA